MIYVDIDWDKNKAYVSVCDVTEERSSELDFQMISFYDCGYEPYKNTLNDCDKEIEKAILNVCGKYYNEIQEKTFKEFIREKTEAKIQQIAKHYDLKILSKEEAKSFEALDKDYQMLNIQTDSKANAENYIIRLDTAQYDKASELKNELLLNPYFKNIEIYNFYEAKRDNDDLCANAAKRRRK